MINMLLPKGITGFSKPPNFDSFLTKKNQLDDLLIRVKQNQRFKLIQFEDIEASTNYYKLKLLDMKTKENIEVLINSTYPFFCGVNNSSWMELEFTDLPEKLISIFKNLFKYLPPIKLTIKQKQENLINLHKDELRQIKYWKSETIGEIIFNGYD